MCAFHGREGGGRRNRIDNAGLDSSSSSSGRRRSGRTGLDGDELGGGGRRAEEKLALGFLTLALLSSSRSYPMQVILSGR